jgi:hypothetical protein
MAPHLKPDELDFVHELYAKKQKKVLDVYEKLKQRRARRGVAMPHLTAFRKALKGETFKRGRVETRGRKKLLTRKKLQRINTCRKELIKKANGEKEIRWADVLKAARVQVHPSTAARNMQKAGYDIKWRNPREKPLRTQEAEDERKEICSRWRRYPATYWTDTVHLIIDNKKYPIPTYERARRYSKMKKVRGHLRTRGEGLKEGFVKPSTKKHKMNPGAYASVVAGIAKGKVRLWEYLPKGQWNAERAVAMYEGPIMKVLRRTQGVKPFYRVIEDNDPSGYKSNLAKEKKKELKINAVQFPRYSPDLNPCDYFLWDEA